MVVLDEHGASRRARLGSSRGDLGELMDHMGVALESMRTQWRTIADLGTHERMAISQLRIYGAMPMSELASRISLSRAAVTSLIDRLEADGWVARSSDAVDRRRTVVSLLPRSDERFAEVAEAYNAELGEWAKEMDDSEWHAVLAFIHRVTDIAERRAQELRSSAHERALG